LREGAVAAVAVLVAVACVDLRAAKDEGKDQDVLPGERDGGTGDVSVGGQDAEPGPSAELVRDLEWAMWPLPSVAPANGDYAVTSGTVLDERTRLVWQRQSSSATTRDGARAACEALVLEGADDWRLPTRIELLSLVSYRRSPPTVNVVAFPSASGGVLWSTTPDPRAPDQGWSVDFDRAESTLDAVATAHGVRCVRGLPDPKPKPRGDGDLVIDPRTGLTWHRAVGTTAPVTWTDALLACQQAKTGGLTGWRLPTARELESLVDVRATVPPTWDGALFARTEPGIPIASSVTWTITDDPSGTAHIAVDFSLAHVPTAYSAEATALVRCVTGP
jgi:hypothetical protein